MTVPQTLDPPGILCPAATLSHFTFMHFYILHFVHFTFSIISFYLLHRATDVLGTKRGFGKECREKVPLWRYDIKLMKKNCFPRLGMLLLSEEYSGWAFNCNDHLLKLSAPPSSHHLHSTPWSQLSKTRGQTKRKDSDSTSLQPLPVMALISLDRQIIQ